jgi:hypothetical protein
VTPGEKIALDNHPRAKDSIARWKGIGGMAAFALVGFISLRANVPFFDSGLRALVGGVVGYAAAWFVAVQVWRHLAVAEIRRHHRQQLERRMRIEAEVEAARTEREGQQQPA